MIRKSFNLAFALMTLSLLININYFSDANAQINGTSSQSNSSVVTFQKPINLTSGQETNLPKTVTEIKNPQTGEIEALTIKDPQTGEIEFLEYSETQLESSNLDNANNNDVLKRLLEFDELQGTVNPQDELTREELKEITTGQIANKLKAGQVAGSLEALEAIEEEGSTENIDTIRSIQESNFNRLESLELAASGTGILSELNQPFKSCIIKPNSNAFSNSATYDVYGKAKSWNTEIRNYTIDKYINIELNQKGDKFTGNIRSGDFYPTVDIDRIVTKCYNNKDFTSNSPPLPNTIPLKSQSINPPFNLCPGGFNIDYSISGTLNSIIDKKVIKVDNPDDIYFSLRVNSDFVTGKLNGYIQLGPLYESLNINHISTTCTSNY